jgi:hypothetical protein
MRTKSIIGLLVALSMILVVTVAFAQPGKGWRGSGGWGMGTQYQRMYNPATVETVSGTVESVDEITPVRGMHYGIHLLLKTDKETISVHLGPGWYIERLDTKIEKGDKVQVRGSRVTMMGQPAVIAAEVKKGDTVLKLRDDNGIPVWSGWRR